MSVMPAMCTPVGVNVSNVLPGPPARPVRVNVSNVPPMGVPDGVFNVSNVQEQGQEPGWEGGKG